MPQPHRLLVLGLTFAVALIGTTQAQDLPPPGDGERLFGFEFEFAGQGNRVVNFEDMPWENYQRLMSQVVEHYGADPAEIRKVEFTTSTSNLQRYPSGERTLFRAEWTDPRGRTWQIVPEFVATSGYDGYELVTPPMDDPAELQQVLERVQNSGLVREGNKSGTHLTIDGRRLVTPEGNARALANLIVLHENLEPELRRLFNPVRGGGANNRFARSLAQDHPELLVAIDRLRPEERTRENLERIFNRYGVREAELQGVDAETPSTSKRPWKYRSMNLGKILDVNPTLDSADVVEFRMFDLSDAETHRLEAEVYRRLVRHAEELAAQGIDVRYEPRAETRPGGDWVADNMPLEGERARARILETLESIGLEPERFEPLLERNVRNRGLPTAAEAAREVAALPRGRVTHNGEAFTYGFELEGSGEGFARIGIPKDPEMRERWHTLSDAQKYDYYREKVGDNRRAVTQHFDLDLERYPWLDPNWKTEYTGNWEVRSLPFESIGEATDHMREIKRLTGRSAKGFHLHMRDNNPDWEALEAKGPQFADFLERAGNSIWLERMRRLRSDIGLKTSTNTRPGSNQLSAWESLRSSGRSTLRTVIPSDRSFLDLEIRGLTTWPDDVERYAKVFTEKLRTLDFGPWEPGDNPLPVGGETSPKLEVEAERYLRDVEGREMTATERGIVEMLAKEVADKASGNARQYSNNIVTPLLGWESEASISESLQRDLTFGKEEFLRKVLAEAGNVEAGRYGFNANYANEGLLVERLGLSEASAKALVELRNESGGQIPIADLEGAGLSAAESERVREAVGQRPTNGTAAGQFDYDGLEKNMRLKVREWARSNTLAEGLFESLLPREGAERGQGFAREVRGNERSAAEPRVGRAEAREVFDSVRDAALARAGEGIEDLPSGSVRDAMARSVRALEGARFEVVTSGTVDARATGDGRVRITTGLLNQLDARAEQLPPQERPAFRRRALGLVLAHELSHVGGSTSERTADAEAVRTLSRSSLGRINGVEVPLGEVELRETLRAFELPPEASRVERLSYRLRSLGSYGTERGRLENLRSTVRATYETSVERGSGLPLPSAAERELERRAEAERLAREGREGREAEVRAPERAFDRSSESSGAGTRGIGVAESAGMGGILEGRLRRAVDRVREGRIRR